MIFISRIIVGLLCLAGWLAIMNNDTSSRIRNSNFWLAGWVASMVLTAWVPLLVFPLIDYFHLSTGMIIVGIVLFGVYTWISTGENMKQSRRERDAEMLALMQHNIRMIAPSFELKELPPRPTLAEANAICKKCDQDIERLEGRTKAKDSNGELHA